RTAARQHGSRTSEASGGTVAGPDSGNGDAHQLRPAEDVGFHRGSGGRCRRRPCQPHPSGGPATLHGEESRQKLLVNSLSRFSPLIGPSRSVAFGTALAYQQKTDPLQK